MVVCIVQLARPAANIYKSISDRPKYIEICVQNVTVININRLWDTFQNISFIGVYSIKRIIA